MSYNSLLSYGDFIALNITCNVNKLFKEIEQFTFQKYNPRKPDIKRNGLSITSLDGKLDGIDLDSIKEYNKENNVFYNEHTFKKFTDVFYESDELQKLITPFTEHTLRSHILHLPPGGYFPPHRDMHVYKSKQESFRVLVPLKNCNPPHMYFNYEDKILNFEHGRAYFLNTNKSHNLFSYTNSYLIVLNIDSNEETFEIIGNNMMIS